MHRLWISRNWSVLVLKFMPWKKRYHRLLKNDAESRRMMHDEMMLASMMSPVHYLPSIVRLVLQSVLWFIYDLAK